jgi:S1-C subfamily serine protease
MERVVGEMRDSFRRLPGVLPDAARAGETAEQRIDLLAGLQLRRPERTRTGFYVGRDGAVLTTSAAVDGCARVTIGPETAARVEARDAMTGLALLRPETVLAPRQVAAFGAGTPRLRSEVAVAGYSYGDALSLPLVTYGTLVDTRGLDGEDSVVRLSLDARPGDAGGPVMDAAGRVVGALQAQEDDGARRLPEDVAFAVDVPTIVEFLSGAGLLPSAAEAAEPRSPEDLVDLAADMAVQVNCWD